MDELITLLRNTSKTYEGHQVSSGLRGAVVGYLNKYLGKEIRYAFLGLLFAPDVKPMSSKELTSGQMKALERWIDPTQIDEKHWVVSDQFIVDCEKIKAFYRGLNTLKAGVSILDTHCSICGRSTPHLYTGYKLVCLVCYPEKDYRKEEGTDEDETD